MIVWLDNPECAADAVGPKAESLARLRRAGLPVPDGFALSASASEVMLTPDVEHLWQVAQTGGDWRRHAVALRAALATAPMCADVANALEHASQQLRAPLAVRSSCLVEDRRSASFAGLFTTFLGVADFQDLQTAVRTCWASRFSDTVIRYALGRGVDLRTTRMAVVVQEAINARSAGTAVSADPTGDLVITGAWGLGRAVAEGEVVPDWWRVGRHDLRVREYRTGMKRLAARLHPHGGEVWRRQNQRRATAACLDAQQISRLTVLVKKAEGAFGNPVEVEWALDQRQRFWLLQARPVRQATSEAETIDAPNGTVAWLRNGSVLEGQPTSPGRVVGRAQLLRDPALIRPQDVLIARTLPPASTAVLPPVAGLVVEAAGSTAHAATLARERGIPAVMGALGATRVIPEGTLVLVDGAAGRVWYRR